jgi:soluble lytic murein transglycosylase-like protein
MIVVLFAQRKHHHLRIILFVMLMAQAMAMHAAYAGELAFAVGMENPEKLSAPELTALAARYEHAEGVPRDIAKAINLYCAAARMGYANAQYALGWMYAHGRGMPRDDGLARHFFEMATKQGHEQASEMLRLVATDVTPILPSCLQQASDDSNAPQVKYPKGPIYHLVHKLAPRYGIDPQLALAIIQVESAFNTRAVSAKNAQGLMQLTRETAVRFRVRDAFDPEDNIKGGLTYLQKLLTLFKGNVPLVLAAYNAGERAVTNHQGIPPYAETQSYVRKITFLYGKTTHPFQEN